MNIEIQAIHTIEEQENIAVDEMLEAIARALTAAYYEYKELPENNQIRVRTEIDSETGEVIVWRTNDAGEEYDDTPLHFEVVGASAVREAILRKLREADTRRAFDDYADIQGQVVSGIVQADAIAAENGIVVVRLGTEFDGRDGILLPAEQVPNEKLKHGDRVRVYVVEVNQNPRNLQILLSRTHPEMIQKLFELEVPEVADGSVEIVHIAREAGNRSKVAVKPTVKGLNAKGACIGPRGQRVSAIMRELKGEKMDIIDYSDSPTTYIRNALAPAKVLNVEVTNEETLEARVTVPDYQLSLAIGKEGQNVRLAARLTGWKIDIHSDAE
ncbi:MAG: transcription termination factor NusA [Corynebacterium sp.]|nr:transcription termination factor NusA [Corynebacterium sp.]